MHRCHLSNSNYSQTLIKICVSSCHQGWSATTNAPKKPHLAIYWSYSEADENLSKVFLDMTFHFSWAKRKNVPIDVSFVRQCVAILPCWWFGNYSLLPRLWWRLERLIRVFQTESDVSPDVIRVYLCWLWVSVDSSPASVVWAEPYWSRSLGRTTGPSSKRLS